MRHVLPNQVSTLGADLRALRKARGLTLSDLAARLHRSVGWMSQVERDLSLPSIGDLRSIAEVLQVPLSLLFRAAPAEAAEAGIIVRRDSRRSLGATADGLVEELLSPDLTDNFEVVHSTFAPRSELAEAISRPTHELGYITSGALDLEIEGRRHALRTGDSFRIRGQRYRWINPHDTPAVVIWVIAPPVY